MTTKKTTKPQYPADGVYVTLEPILVEIEKANLRWTKADDKVNSCKTALERATDNAEACKSDLHGWENVLLTEAQRLHIGYPK